MTVKRIVYIGSNVKEIVIIKNIYRKHSKNHAGQQKT